MLCFIQENIQQIHQVTDKISKLKTTNETAAAAAFDHSRSYEFDRMPRTSFLLKPAQMAREGYAKPGQHAFTATQPAYEPVTDKSPLFALNCELVHDDESGEIELAWIVLVNEHLEVFQEIFVKPDPSYLNIIERYVVASNSHKQTTNKKSFPNRSL